MTRTSHLRALTLGLLFLAAGPTACAEAQEDMHPEVALSPLPSTCGTQQPGRLCGCVYDVPVETRRLPDFSAFRPLEMICTDRLTVGVRKGSPGFPGVTSRYEWFGVDFQGDVVVGEPGVFSFRLASDDGAKLYVDDVLVLNNDGRHDVAAVEGTVALEAGPHRVRVPYFNGPGPMALTLEVAPPGRGYEVLRVDRVL